MEAHRGSQVILSTAVSGGQAGSSIALEGNNVVIDVTGGSSLPAASI